MRRAELAIKVQELMREYARRPGPRSLSEIVDDGMHFPFRATSMSGASFLVSPNSVREYNSATGQNRRLDFLPLSMSFYTLNPIRCATYGGDDPTWYLGPKV